MKDPESYKERAHKVMEHYGLFVLNAEHITRASERTQTGEELLEQIEQTKVSEKYSLYRTFHTYPPLDN